MLTQTFFKALLVAVSVLGAYAHPQKNVLSEPVQSPAQGVGRQAPAVVATKEATVDGKTVAANTTVSTLAVAAPAALVAGTSTKSTILIFARDAASAYSATSGLSGYAIPFQVVTVPQAGITLPALNSSSTAGNYGAVVIRCPTSKPLPVPSHFRCPHGPY